MVALSGTYPAVAQRIGSPTGHPDPRPIGMTPEPYGLEIYDTAIAGRPILEGDPATFELFGFKLGMSVREADRNAKRLGLHFNGGNLTNPSFDGRVKMQAASLLGRNAGSVPRVLERTSMTDANGHHYLLQFLPMEAGATLSSITYIGSWDGNSPAQYLAALQAKFGKPTSKYTNTESLDARWCSKGDLLALCDTRPAFGAIGTRDVNLVLLMGNRARTDLDHRIEVRAASVAATERKAPAF
ncbi:hypothetical protein KX816_05235 [Sphingosinicellaceae bacterium]|nr:hypothetical protein KX816_05235 [Sphingosinicellaceae bacterium]